MRNESSTKGRAGRVDRLILVYNADSGVTAMLLDALKKAVGREDCALCEVVYSPLGKRRDWSACEKRLALPVDELHRDRIPAEWRLSAEALPCVLARSGVDRPFVLVPRDDIAACRGSIPALESRIADALASLGSRPDQPAADRLST